MFRNGIILFLLIGPSCLLGQSNGFDSFISRISEQYKVDVAIAPELIPTLDSIRNIGAQISSIEELLHRLLNHSGITYQILDGNKLMLRREYPIDQKNSLTVLRGIVLDASSGNPLPFATIFAPSDNAACNSDEYGQFILPVTDTSGNVEINYLGYRTLIMPAHVLLSGNISVKMEIQKIPLKEVVVIVPYRLVAQDYNEQSTDLDGYQFITEEQLLNWNAERLITSLTMYTHYSSEQGIRIRGSDAGNSLILMDEIPVYDPYHFYNIFSPFNGQYFSSVQVYKNNLPIEYGGRIDGLIQLQSNREQPQSKLILDTDLLLTSLTTEWVLSPKIYLMAGGRISHTGILNEALSDSSSANFSLPGKFKGENEWSTSQQPVTNFYDVNLGLAVEPGERSKISLGFFDSQDHLDNTSATSFEATGQNHEIISVEQSYVSQDQWKNRGISANLEVPLSDKVTWQFKGFNSIFNKESTYNSEFIEERNGTEMTRYNSGYQQSHLNTAGLKGYIQKQTGTRSEYLLGAEIQHHQVDFSAKENNMPFLTQSQKENEASFFGEYRFRLNNTMDWSLGSRLTSLQSTGRSYFLPNFGVIYTLDDHYNLRAAFSKNLQSVHSLTVEDRFGREVDYLVLSQPEEGYPVLKADKYMIGAGYTSSYLGIDAECYYKKMDGLTSVRTLRPDPSYGEPSSPDDHYQLIVGEGWTAGIDFTILYKKKKIEASVLYTLSKIAEQYDQIFNGNYFSPQEDRRHQIKMAGTYKMGKFQATTLLTYKSQAPYLSLVRLDGGDGIGMADQGMVYRYLPPYFSLDFGLDYSFRCFKQPAMIGVSLINATNHENINDLQHLGKVNREGGGIYLTNQTELLGRTANVHFRYLLN